MQTIYYLDTTIQLTKLFGPSAIRQRLRARIQADPCVVSSYVRMEYLRWLQPCIQVHQLLQEEIAHNRATALSEVQARIYLLPDPIACPLMDLKAIPHGTSYRLEPDLPYRRGEMPCHIVDFLQEQRIALQELAPALEEAYPKMADACRRVLANPADAQGNLCKTLGDVIITLQTPADAVLWTTDAAYDIICPTLGIAHVREPITTQAS